MRTFLPPSLCRALNVLGIAALIAIISGNAFAEPVKTLLSSGPSANRVDIVLLGDGYTAEQMSNYVSDVTAIAGRMFDQDPFRIYQSYFNVHYVEVVSAQSGADHPSRRIAADTALGATYDCADIQRLICVDTTAVEDVLARSVKPDQRDLVIVVVNDREYGGSGGWFAVTSVHSEATEIVLHEMGHSFGQLADEYASSPPTCENSTEPEEPNVTIVTARAAIKWVAWIEPTTPVPTLTANDGEPGLYEQARYCESGMYRPTFDSKMRSLGRPYEQINVEQLVLRIYNLVSPIDQVAPTAAVVKASSGQTVEFRIKPLVPAGHRLQVLWSVDGRSMSTASRYLLATGGLPPGDHTVVVTIRDTTPLVRNDPSSVLEDSRSWTLRVAPRTTVPSVRVVTPNGGEHVAVTMATTVRWDASDPDGLRRFDVSLSLDGKSFTAIEGCTGLAGTARSCAWTPAMTGLQAWIRVAAIDAAGTAGQDTSDRPFSLETRAHIVLERLASLLRSIDASDFHKKRALETRLASAIAAEQHGHPKTMCHRLGLVVKSLEAPPSQRISGTTALRREARKAVVTLGCSGA